MSDLEIQSETAAIYLIEPPQEDSMLTTPSGVYWADRTPVSEESVINMAIEILTRRLTARTKGPAVENPQAAITLMSKLARLELAEHPEEHFMVLFLNMRHEMLAQEVLFRGSVDSCHIYPRVIVRRALELNASAVVLAHNHPSGVPEPSAADGAITHRIKKALAFVDVRVLDHLVIGKDSATSLATLGMM